VTPKIAVKIHLCLLRTTLHLKYINIILQYRFYLFIYLFIFSNKCCSFEHSFQRMEAKNHESWFSQKNITVSKLQ